MCGIVGILNKRPGESSIDPGAIVRMRDVISFRGPDDMGLYSDPSVSLGHRRLSIIDLSTGHQPMCNEDGTVWIAFNGEVFNFKSLRDTLVQRGHKFKTASDTETILHLYEEAGVDCVKSLNGMFAFAIWDKTRERLFLARDRMGVKPLYYSDTPSALAFSSEIKSLHASGLVRAECDESGVLEYLVFRHVAGESTMYEGVKSLPPGHIAVFERGGLSVRRYWSAIPEQIREYKDNREAIRDLTALFEDAVKVRMISDVPLGTFCSGGIDSSLVTSMAAGFARKPINTFSVGFDEKEYDETSYAQIVSRKYGTSHHEIRVGNEEFAGLLERMIWHNDEPLNFPNSILIYAVSKLAREHVTVVLTGEGSDELFSGYPRYQIPRLINRIRRVPGFARRMFDLAAALSSDHRLEKLKTAADSPFTDVLLYNSATLPKDFMDKHLEVRPEDFKFRSGLITELLSRGFDPVTAVSLYDQHTYLVSILNRQDKMSMAASIESRVPFLDYRVVEFANALPLKYKVSGAEGKMIVKKIARSFLPKDIITRRKSGFGVPLKDWFRSKSGLGPLVHDISSCPLLTSHIKKSVIDRIVREHLDGSADHSEFLWTAVNLNMWHSSVRSMNTNYQETR